MSNRSHATPSPAHAGQTATSTLSAPARRRAGGGGPGNQAIQRLLRDGAIRAKLTVSQTGDRFEQEADRVAETVMRMPGPAATAVAASGPPLRIQRACPACEEELQRKPASGPEVAGPDFRHPQSGGRPLPDSERRFFEPRFGRDLGNVRIHSGPEAGAASRSVDALAYTMGSDVVFGAGQYQPGTQSGRTLLAHELTHVAQQATGATPAVQRLGDLTKVPPGLACPVAVDNPAFVDTAVLFPLGASNLTPAGVTAIATFLTRWNAAGANKPVRVDGYASTDGADATNWTLSCDRALRVEAELTAPSAGGPGVPGGLLSHFAQGETSEFGAALDLNRRATISSDITAPPLPACANPGVSRTLDLQPVLLRTDPADASPTGRSWIRRFNEANVIWGKLGVTFVERAPVTIDTPLKTGGNTAADQAAIRALRAAAGVEIFLVDNDMPAEGGGVTEGAPLAARCVVGNIILSDRGTSVTILAHELGHILGIRHPGVAPNPGDPATIMEPSGSNSVENPTRNTMANFAAILCPAPTGTTCLHPDP